MNTNILKTFPNVDLNTNLTPIDLPTNEIIGEINHE